jgi:hypothetical protein
MTQRLINGPFLLRALKVLLALALGTPATLIWMPYMVPFALFGPFMLVSDALSGHVNVTDLRGIAIAIAGTAGLAGFWLWVFDHPGRSTRMQRGTGLLWLAGAAVLAAHLLLLPELSGALFAATVALTVVVVLMGLAMSIRPRAPRLDAGPAR